MAPYTPRNRVYCNCRFRGLIAIHIAHKFKKQLEELLYIHRVIEKDSQTQAKEQTRLPPKGQEQLRGLLFHLQDKEPYNVQKLSY